MRIILLGPPGSGKGYPRRPDPGEVWLSRISSGDLLRMLSLRAMDLGKKAEDFMNRGELVSDELWS